MHFARLVCYFATFASGGIGATPRTAARPLGCGWSACWRAGCPRPRTQRPNSHQRHEGEVAGQPIKLGDCHPGLLRRRVPGYAKAPTCNNTAITVVRVCSSNFARARSRSPVDRRPLASGGDGASLPKKSARSSSASTTARRIVACKEVPFSNASISSRDGRRSMDGCCMLADEGATYSGLCVLPSNHPMPNAISVAV